MGRSVWTFSNMLSIARALLVVPIAKLLLLDDPSSRAVAVALLVVAVATDFFDGMIARKLRQETELGKVIDPLADKIAVGVVACILAFQGKMPLWFLLTLLVRDAAILLGGMYVRRSKGILLQSNEAGKWAVTVVAVLVLFIILEPPGFGWLRTALFAASTGLLTLSFGLYCRRFLAINRQER